MSSSNPPDDVVDAVKYIQNMRAKTYLSRDERENLNRAKLRVAYWACRSEGIIASRENLAYVLGSDAADIMKAYDKYLEAAKNAPPGKGKQKKQTGVFWDGA
ncbi:MAG: hypothetical protein LIQ31_04825 [Planctomycetes bacterium]|nr:hypothetical protein [Planctomycetota bacterium]